MYTWDSTTIKPLFGSPVFRWGEERESQGFGSTGKRNMPEMRMRVEFDYVLYPAASRHVLKGRFYCLRR